MSTLGALLLIAIICMAGLIFVGVLFYAFVPFKVTNRSLPSAKRRMWAVGAATAVAAVLVPSAPALLTSSGRHAPRASLGAIVNVSFTNPAQPLSGGTEPQVPCKMTVEGRGNVPPGYQLVLATQHVGDSTRNGDQEIDFESDVQWDTVSKTWSAGVTFGTKSTIGFHYRLSAVIVPAALLTYLVRAVNWKKENETWWPQSGLPPGSRQASTLTVEQISATGCKQ